MTSGEAKIGMRVRVRKDHWLAHMRGECGTVTHIWGDPNYVALDVRLDDGDQKLFWHHELDEDIVPA